MGFIAWLKEVTGERKGYVKGYRQALKDVWVLPKGDIRLCFGKCKYQTNGNCNLTNDNCFKCPRIKKYIKGAKV